MASYSRDFYRQVDTTALFFPEGFGMKLILGTQKHYAVLAQCTTSVPLAGEVAAANNSCSASSEGSIPLLTIRVASASGNEGNPVIRSQQSITGDVVLVIQKDQKFKDITVRLRGCIVNPQTNKTFFLDIEQSLVPQWSGLVSTYKAGRHIMPFRIILPAFCNVTFTNCLLPPTFSSRGQPMSVRYDISARIKKPGLWADEQVTMPILYMPRTRPVDYVPLRELDFGCCKFALQRASEMLTWAETSRNFSASIENSRTVIFDCSFSLANAPVYTRGVFISYMLSLEAWDGPALDLVGNPQAVSVSLIRQVIVDTPGGFSGLGTSTGKPERVTDIVGQGRHWLEPGDQYPKRVFRGEIPLRKELRPHFAFPPLSVIYSVVVQLQADGFSPTNKAEEYLFGMPVGIATDLPEKVRRTAA